VSGSRPMAQAAVGVPEHRLGHSLRVQRGPLGAHHLHQGVAQQRVEAAQRCLLAHEELRLRSQRVQHARELDGDVARAHHGRAAGQPGERKEPVDAMLRARNVGTGGAAAGGDQDVVGRDPLAPDLDGARIDEPGEALDQVHPVPVQPRLVGGMDAADVGAAAAHQRRPVEAVHRGVESVVGAIVVDGLRDLRGMPHHLLGHTAHVDAGAAEGLGLDQRAFPAVGGCPVDGGDAAAAAANGDVVVVFHRCMFPGINARAARRMPCVLPAPCHGSPEEGSAGLSTAALENTVDNPCPPRARHG